MIPGCHNDLPDAMVSITLPTAGPMPTFDKAARVLNTLGVLPTSVQGLLACAGSSTAFGLSSRPVRTPVTPSRNGEVPAEETILLSMG